MNVACPTCHSCSPHSYIRYFLSFMTIAFNGSSKLDLSNGYKYYKIFQISKATKQGRIFIHPDEWNDPFTLIDIHKHLKNSHRHVIKIRKLVLAFMYIS